VSCSFGLNRQRSHAPTVPAEDRRAWQSARSGRAVSVSAKRRLRAPYAAQRGRRLGRGNCRHLCERVHGSGPEIVVRESFEVRLGRPSIGEGGRPSWTRRWFDKAGHTANTAYTGEFRLILRSKGGQGRPTRWRDWPGLSGHRIRSTSDLASHLRVGKTRCGNSEYFRQQ